MNSVFIQWSVHPKDRPCPVAPHPERDRLFAEHLGLFFWLAYRFLRYANPLGDRSVSADDLAAEFMLVAVRRFPRWRHDRVGFSKWSCDVARAHAHYLRQKALRQKRAAVTLGQFAGDDFDRFAATADPWQAEPWEIAAECDERMGSDGYL
jgi:DNA-directed RNA polymerase specialized sigma24 family protein